jgi:uncharacterized protein YjbJ (UPF0337 family)
MVGDTHHDPTDHHRTTNPRAGITAKDNFFWPGFILLAVAISGIIGTVAVAAYRHYEWLATTALVAVLGTVAGTLWFLVEVRHVTLIDQEWARVQGTTEAVKAVVEDVKGKAKELAGAVTGRDDLTEEGRIQQDKAAAERDAVKREADA